MGFNNWLENKKGFSPTSENDKDIAPDETQRDHIYGRTVAVARACITRDMFHQYFEKIRVLYL